MNSDTKLLNEIYQNSITAINAISSMLIKIRDEKLYNCLFEQMLRYREIANNAKSMLNDTDSFPSSLNFFEKSGFHLAVDVVGFGHISSRRLAKILISGSKEGIFDLANHINSCTDASQQSRFLAYDLIGIEEESINKMNEFL